MLIANPCFHCHNYCDETNCHIRHYPWYGNNEAEDVEVTEKTAFEVLGFKNFDELSAERFTYELWGSDFWNMLGLDYGDSMEFDKLIAKVKEYGIGWCESSRLNIRPRENSIAVMCERDGEKFWFHLNKYCFGSLG